MLAAALEAARRGPAIALSPQAHGQELVHRRIAARGSFVPGYTIFLDNKVRGGRAGYEVVTPLRLSGSDVHVLVDRGWVAAPPRREILPAVPTPQGELALEGIGFARFARTLHVGGEETGQVRQTLDIGQFVAQTGLTLKSVILEQLTDTHDGLLRDWPEPDLGVDMHRSYALQWYSLALLAAVSGLHFAFRRK